MTHFDIEQYWSGQTQEHLDVFQKTAQDLSGDFQTVLSVCVQTIRAGHKIMFCGNGGSAADAQHLATELTIRFIKDRAPIAAIALTTDSSTLSAAGNDLGFDYIFSRQVEAIGQKGDTLIAISTSGNSPNIIRALESARAQSIHTVGLSGRDGGKMRSLCDTILVVPSETTARIQEIHILLGHMLCGALEESLGLVA